MSPSAPAAADGQERSLREQAHSLRRRVGGNTLWLLMGRIGSQGLMVIFTALVARRLGEAGLGQYSFIVSAILLANVVTTFGTDMLLVREIAARRALSLLPAALFLQLGVSIPLILLAFLFAPSLPNQSSQAVLALQVYSLALVPLAFFSVFSAALRGFERMDSFTLLNLTTACVQVAGVWFFVRPGASVVMLALILLAVQAFSASLAGGLCLAQIPGLRQAWRTSMPAILTLARASASIALLGLMKVIYQRLGVYLLSLLQGAAATGLFSAAVRAVEASQVGHVVLLGALFPVMAQAHTGGEKRVRLWEKTFSASWQLLLLLGGAGAALLFLLAPVVVRVLFGADFAPSVLVLRLLSWVLLPYSVNIYLSTQFLSARRERQVAYALGASLLALAGLDAWLIPRWGPLGAGLAALCAETVQAALFLWFWRHGPITSRHDSGRQA